VETVISDETQTAERLVNGAKLIGQLYRSGQRCGAGWKFGCPDAAQAKTKLCRAKGQWEALAAQAGQKIPDDQAPPSDFEFIGELSIKQLVASGFTMTVDLGDGQPIKVGPAGVIPVADFVGMARDPQGMEGVLKVLREFPGSKVTGTEEPAKEAEKKP